MSTSSDLKDKVFLDMAVTLGQLGTCDRATVGCIITRDGRSVSWGYNGAPPGMPHCKDNEHGWKAKFVEMMHEQDRNTWKTQEMADWCELMVGLHGCRNATHAEANTLAFAARQGISTDGGTLYVERSPCIACARLCIAAGIARVVCSKMYRDTTGAELLLHAGVGMSCLDN